MPKYKFILTLPYDVEIDSEYDIEGTYRRNNRLICKLDIFDVED